MIILITGVNGFIGQSLAEYLDRRGIEVHGLDIQDNSSKRVKKYYKVDIKKKFILQEEYDYVIHLAGLSRTNVDVDYDYDRIKKINVDGVVNTIHSCKFGNFIFFSSVLVYSRKTEEVHETSEICLKSLYSRTKYEAECALRALLPPNKYIILRPVNVIGLRQKNVASIPIFFEKAVRNEDINIFVPANKTMQLLDVEDLCRLIEMIIDYGFCGIYNVSPKEYIEINDLVKKILKLTNSNSSIIYSNNNLESKSVIKAESLYKVSGWKANKSIDDILIEFYIKKYKKNKVMNIEKNII